MKNFRIISSHRLVAGKPRRVIEIQAAGIRIVKIVNGSARATVREALAEIERGAK